MISRKSYERIIQEQMLEKNINTISVYRQSEQESNILFLTQSTIIELVLTFYEM